MCVAPCPPIGVTETWTVESRIVQIIDGVFKEAFLILFILQS